MRRLRDRLNNKKGFTLVELIVVIVIILILAAVLVPNVMRYIGQAREAAFQSEASTYLTEIQGFEADKYAKENADIKPNDFVADASGKIKYQLTGFTAVISGSANFSIGTISPFPVTGSNSGGKKIQATVEKGGVTRFTYQDKDHYVSWEQGKGWTNVDDTTFKN